MNNNSEIFRKPKVGLLLIGCSRFRNMGKGLKKGTYEERKKAFARDFIERYKDVIEICFEKVVYTPEDVDNAINFFFNQKVECIISIFLSWSEDKTWIKFLREMYDLPLLYYLPTIPGPDDSRNEESFIEFLAKGGAVGAHVGSGSIPRLNRNAEIVVDTIEDAKKSIKAFSYASLARKKLRNARFGLMAGYNEVMWSTYVDPYNIFYRIGPELNFLSYTYLKKLIDKVSDDESRKYVKYLKENYRVEKNVDETLFLESARASIGLVNVIKEKNLSALILNDVSTELFEIVGLRPGFYHPSIDEIGAILSLEGDLGFGVLNYALKIMTGKAINLIEPFYLDKDSNTFYGGHAGPQDHTDKHHKNRVKISTDTRFAKTPYKYAGAPFAWYRIPPGEKTIAHFSEISGKYKVVCFKAESLKGDHTLSGYHHSKFRTDKPVTELFKNILSTGTTQHFASVEGDITEELAIFSRINNFEFYKY